MTWNQSTERRANRIRRNINTKSQEISPKPLVPFSQTLESLVQHKVEKDEIVKIEEEKEQEEQQGVVRVVNEERRIQNKANRIKVQRIRALQ